MNTLRLKSVKQPVCLEHLGYAEANIGGQNYKAGDMVPIHLANYLLGERSKWANVPVIQIG